MHKSTPVTNNGEITTRRAHKEQSKDCKGQACNIVSFSPPKMIKENTLHWPRLQCHSWQICTPQARSPKKQKLDIFQKRRRLLCRLPPYWHLWGKNKHQGGKSAWWWDSVDNCGGGGPFVPHMYLTHTLHCHSGTLCASTLPQLYSDHPTMPGQINIPMRCSTNVLTHKDKSH